LTRNTKTLQRHFEKYTPVPLSFSVPVHSVALTFDGTFFGRGYGLMYHDFLMERNEKKQFMHRKLRSALNSLTRNAPLLFTSINDILN